MPNSHNDLTCAYQPSDLFLQLLSLSACLVTSQSDHKSGPPVSQAKFFLVRAFGVIGGGAALAFVGATAGQAIIQAGVLGGLGIAGK